MKLGRFVYDKPVMVLAPMAGVSDLPFRRLCQQFGADYTVAEMVSAKPDLLSTELSQKRLSFDDDASRPKIVQLLGADKALMIDAAQMLEAKGIDVLDINMGCPAKRVGKDCAGSALLADVKRVGELLKALCEAVKIPVTLKTRLGFDDNTAIFRVGQLAEEAGVVAIALHGRTRSQRFTGTVDYHMMGKFAEQSALPVIANGDIVSPEQAQNLLSLYPFAGIMIGRAAQGNPHLFAKCQNLINDKALCTQLTRQHIISHISALHQHYGMQGILIARKHLHHYLRDNAHYHELQPRINEAQTSLEQLALLDYWED
ncbi:MAG: tRNA-dihydrouridine synthase [Cardiobacteriaceae bacterium]|nr:tRNA-dihydrouridine synthase [Cardiobacteriaceae bacterium]